MSLLPFERETIITSSDEDKDKWHIYTRQKKIINKMLKQGREPIGIQKDENGDIYSAEFEIGIKEISFRNPKKTNIKRNVSQEEIERRREQCRELGKKNKVEKK